MWQTCILIFDTNLRNCFCLQEGSYLRGCNITDKLGFIVIKVNFVLIIIVTIIIITGSGVVL